MLTFQLLMLLSSLSMLTFQLLMLLSSLSMFTIPLLMLLSSLSMLTISTVDAPVKTSAFLAQSSTPPTISLL
ncbi:hypothetical protein F3157_19065 [Virgibacillus dakarensis]|nr:hypothetical protein [Virgibacillus dakarensis]